MLINYITHRGQTATVKTNLTQGAEILSHLILANLEIIRVTIKD